MSEKQVGQPVKELLTQTEALFKAAKIDMCLVNCLEPILDLKNSIDALLNELEERSKSETEIQFILMRRINSLRITQNILHNLYKEIKEIRENIPQLYKSIEQGWTLT